MPSDPNRIGYGVASFNPDVANGRTEVAPPKLNSKIDKWRRWNERIGSEMVEEIFTNRAAYREWIEMLKRNPEIPHSDIIDFQIGNYGRSQAVAVRRQTDVGRQSVSLGRLLQELSSDNGLITREWWVGQYEWGHQERGDTDFDQFAYLDPKSPDKSETGAELSQRKVEHDIERLNAEAAMIRKYVDKVIAHSDEKADRVEIPTLSDLDAAIDVLGNVFHTYNLLLTTGWLMRLDATPQFDRLAPFRMPWATD